MFMIEVDAAVYHAILARCTAAGVTASEVLRPSLDLPPTRSRPASAHLAPASRPARPTHWYAEDVAFEVGTELRGTGRYASCRGVVVANGIQVNAITYRSISEAATHACGSHRNGWKFWKCKQGRTWKLINTLRKPESVRRRVRRTGGAG